MGAHLVAHPQRTFFSELPFVGCQCQCLSTTFTGAKLYSKLIPRPWLMMSTVTTSGPSPSQNFNTASTMTQAFPSHMAWLNLWFRWRRDWRLVSPSQTSIYVMCPTDHDWRWPRTCCHVGVKKSALTETMLVQWQLPRLNSMMQSQRNNEELSRKSLRNQAT